GFTALGFGLVFIGLNTLTAAMKPVIEKLLLQATLTQIPRSPFHGYLLGFFSTALVQNNIATIGLLQAFLRQVALTGQESLFLSLPEVLPILLGTSLGIGVIPTVAALKGNILTKRAATVGITPI